MNNKRTKLFYSYSHVDEQYRQDMERALALLKRNSNLQEWHDRKITAGQKWSEKIRKELETSDIVAFIVTPDFLSSEACVEEWEIAKSLPNITLVSIIVRDCPWQDFDEMSDFQVLPKDGKAIALWEDEDTAWKDVYEGLKKLLEELQATFLLDTEFRQNLTRIEFCSQSRDTTQLEDVFVFPQVYTYMRFADTEKQIHNADELLEYNLALIRGENQSGKSKLCAHLFLHLIENDNPALIIDLEEIKSKTPNINVFEKKYIEEFSGDFDLWRTQKDVTVIFDNLTSRPHSLQHITLAKNTFSKVIVATSSDSYNAYFKDEVALSDFSNFRIGPFNHNKQEQLIRKWLSLSSDKSDASREIEHARVDKIERDVNSVLINNKVVPRYPFYILSILQTHEYFMPRDMQITAYGHCYYALIIANLIKSGIDSTDENINPCFNFASHLAFHIHLSGGEEHRISSTSFSEFKTEYKKKYLINDSLINRLCSTNGLLRTSNEGYVCFNLPYSYYFFLGRHLAQTYEENNPTLSKMMEHSFVRENTLALTFAIHHAQDSKILDDILMHTVCSVDQFEPAKLDQHETKIFNKLLETIPKKILSERSVESERAAEREKLDQSDKVEEEEDYSSSEDSRQIYVSQKNMEILSQILKNKAGVLEKSRIEEVVEILCDAGLRIISIFLCNDKCCGQLFLDTLLKLNS